MTEVLYSPHMVYSTLFNGFGWLLIATAVCLLIIPWRYDQRFASHVVPKVPKYISSIGLISLALGMLIFVGLSLGGVT